jgi:hypothetical protein
MNISDCRSHTRLEDGCRILHRAFVYHVIDEAYN